MPLLNPAEYKGSQRISQQNGTADKLYHGNCSHFQVLILKKLKKSENLLKWRIWESFCLHWEGTQRVQAKKNLLVAFKTDKTEETSNFQNIPLFSSSVVQTKLPTFKLHWKTFAVQPSWGWAAPCRAGGWFGVLRLQLGEGGQIL